MIIRLSKDLPYQILFALCVTVPYLNNYELTFAIWVLTAIITVKKAYSAELIKYILCFSGIFIIALIVSYFKDYKTYNFVRDISYMLKPMLGLAIGYQLCRKHMHPYKTMVYIGLIISLVHIYIIAHSILIYRILTIHKLREYGGYFSDFEIYALIILLFSAQFKLNFHKYIKWFLIATIGLSSLMYLSRINFLQFIIFYMALKGYFVVNRRSVTVMGSLVLATIVLYTVLFSIPLHRNGRGLEAFFFKVRNAPIEAFKAKVNRDNYQDFNDNYRSYENIITVQQVTFQGPPGIAFGKGMGATVDLGREIYTNDGEFIRHIPTLHNGFMIVFLKSGLAGVFLNLMFIYLLSRQGKTKDEALLPVSRLLFGTSIFLLLSTWVLMGLYLKTDTTSIAIGFLLCSKIMLARKNVENDANE